MQRSIDRHGKGGAGARALRAARSVTMGLGLGGLGCSSGPVGDDLAGARDAAVAVDRASPVDAAIPIDAAVSVDQAVPGDLPVPKDAVAVKDAAKDFSAFDLRGDLAGFDGECPPGGDVGKDPDCCVKAGGIWINGGCAIPGPFVPPAMDARV